MKISLTQKKIIVLSFIIIATFFIFGFYIYLPNKNASDKIKSELNNVKAQIEEIEILVGKARTLGEGVKEIRQLNQELRDRFPHKEEEALSALSEFAREMNIEVVSIEPQPKKVFLDENGNRVEVENKVCQSVFVSIKMKSSYKDLIRYIETLKDSLPVFVSIENLKINKGSFQEVKLNILLELNLYLLI